MAGLIKGRGDDERILRAFGELDARGEGALAELVHIRDEDALLPLVDEVDTVAARGGVHVAGDARFRQVLFAERQEGHRAFRDLPALFEIEKAHRVQPHIAVVRHGERESEFAVVDKIIIPFLDAQGRDLHVRAAVFLHERAGKAGAGEIALFVEQRAGGRDLGLSVHSDALLTLGADVPAQKFQPFVFSGEP